MVSTRHGLVDKIRLYWLGLELRACRFVPRCAAKLFGFRVSKPRLRMLRLRVWRCQTPAVEPTTLCLLEAGFPTNSDIL